MNRIDIGAFGRRNHGRDVEIGFLRRRRSDLDRLVGKLDGQHVGIGGAINLNRADTERLGGADDADGDFSAIGDKDRAKFHCSTSAITWPAITGSSLSTRKRMLPPATPAWIS